MILRFVFVLFGFAPFRFALQKLSSVNLLISSPLQVSGAVTRLTVYRAATHSLTVFLPFNVSIRVSVHFSVQLQVRVVSEAPFGQS